MFANPFEKLANSVVEENLVALAASERSGNVDIILHLMLVKERQLYAPAGFDSLFSYCTGKLGFSKSTAFRRKAVVDKVAEFPEILARLKDGRLQLCAAAAIALHLKAESAERLFAAVEGMSHREVDAFLVKSWCARPAKVAPVAVASAATFSAERVGFSAGTQPTLVEVAPAQRTIVKPVAPDTNRVSVTLSDKTLASLKRAKEILGNNTDDEVLFKALEKFLDHAAPERRHARREARRERRVVREKTPPAQTAAKAPRKAPATTSRRGRIADRDQVTAAAGSQCTFVAKDGRRCPARTFIEIDHIKPWALGGPSVAENQRPLCRTHNAFFAAQTFGPWKGSSSAETKAPCLRT